MDGQSAAIRAMGGNLTVAQVCRVNGLVGPADRLDNWDPGREPLPTSFALLPLTLKIAPSADQSGTVTSRVCQRCVFHSLLRFRHTLPESDADPIIPSSGPIGAERILNLQVDVLSG